LIHSTNLFWVGYFWDRVSFFLFKLALNYDSPDLCWIARITGVSHWYLAYNRCLKITFSNWKFVSSVWHRKRIFKSRKLHTLYQSSDIFSKGLIRKMSNYSFNLECASVLISHLLLSYNNYLK
jgi:hypothetical protein